MRAKPTKAITATRAISAQVHIEDCAVATCACALTAVFATCVCCLRLRIAVSAPKPEETMPLIVSGVPTVAHSAEQMASPLLVTGCPALQFNWQHVIKS